MPTIILNGTAGRLEASYSPARIDAPVVILLHPHVSFGGNMKNQMLHELNQCFGDLGFAVLRFNFRGTGRTEGTSDDKEAEILDATTALDWLESQHPLSSQSWICGFSFGAWVGMQLLMRRPGVHRFIAIAPPVGPFNFDFLAPCPTSGLIISPQADQYTNLKSLRALIKKLKDTKFITIDHKPIKEADHFLKNHHDHIVTLIQKYVVKCQRQQKKTQRQKK